MCSSDAQSAITFRRVGEGDAAFLYDVYASTRQEELAPLGWSDAQRSAFLQQQFAAQDTHYRQHFGAADFLIILRGGAPVGRLYVDRRADELRIVDIALLPSHRGAGIGGAIMADLLREAATAGKAVRIHVEHNNRALRFYERLGFRRIGEAGVYFLMEWRAAP